MDAKFFIRARERKQMKHLVIKQAYFTFAAKKQ